MTRFPSGHSRSLIAIFAVLAISSTGAAAGEFDGVWKVTDTSGKPFEIMLAANGTAKADRAGEGMTGTWKEDGKSVVINWDTGWTTRISKEGSGYKKTAYKKGQSADGKPVNSSDAKKMK